jgi:23S rRNA pseudouridine2605 synthase
LWRRQAAEGILHAGLMSEHPQTRRLQKILADRGVASRRSAADLIRAGAVSVNGVAQREPGARVNPDNDEIRIRGAPIPTAREPVRTIIMNKPAGLICSAARGQGRTVYSLLRGVTERVVPAGRLDKDTEGLLLLSNNGDLVNRLTHPRFGQKKVYEATVSGPVDPVALRILRSPLDMDGYKTRPARVSVVRAAGDGMTVLQVELGEGRNRQVRRMCEAAGLKVERLVRIRIGNLGLTGLAPGQWRDATAEELRRVLAAGPFTGRQ